MKIKYSCGHIQNTVLRGNSEEKESRVKYLEECGICAECRREQEDARAVENCAVQEMPYSQYKKDYEWCRTKNNSYNPDTKTITVYVPYDYELIVGYARIFDMKHSDYDVIARRARDTSKHMLKIGKEAALKIIVDLEAQYGADNLAVINTKKMIDLVY